MPLQKQKVLVPFSGGLDTKSAKHVVQPGKLLKAENAKLTESGAIMKREQYETVSLTKSAGGSVSRLRAIAGHGESGLVGFDHEKVYEKTTDGWVERGDCTLVSVEEKELERSGNGSYPATADLDDYEVYLYQGSYYTVVDKNSGAFVVSRAEVDSTNTPVGLFRVSGTLAIFVILDGSGNVTAKKFDASDPTVLTSLSGSASTSATSGNNTMVGEYDAGTDKLYVFTLSTHLVVIDPTAESVSSTTYGPKAAGSQQPGLVITDNVVHLLYDVLGTVSAEGLNLSDLTTNAYGATIVGGLVSPPQVTGVATTGSEVRWYTQKRDASNNYKSKIETFTVNESGTVGSVSDYAYAVALAGEAFRDSGSLVPSGTEKTYVPVLYAQQRGTNDNFQACIVLLDESGNPVSRLGYGEAFEGVYRSDLFHFCRAKPNGANYLFLYATLTPSAGGTTLPAYNPRGLRAARFETRRFGCYRESLGKGTLLTQGSMLWLYDGEQAVENQFLIYPDRPVASAGSSGSISGTFTYKVVYVWTDKNGQKHRSAPSLASSSITVSSKEIDVQINPCNLTHKDNVKVEVYRTLDGGSVYYYAGTADNAKGTSLLTFTDTNTDAAIQQTATLYTVSGEVADGAPGVKGALAVSGRRAWVSLGDCTVAYSKEAETGMAAMFSDFFTYKLDEKACRGPIVLQQMDGSLYVLSRSGIQVVRGSGPAVTGVNGSFSPPQTVASDDGINIVNDGSSQNAFPKALATDSGIFYLGKRGIMRLSRSLQTQYIGSPVERRIRSYESAEGDRVVNFSLNPKEHHVICSTTGGFLVFDYLQNQWLEWTLSSATLGVIDAEVVSDRLYAILYDTNTGDFDSLIKLPDLEDRNGTPLGAAEPMTIETPWIKLDNLAGFQRIYYCTLLAEWRSAHTNRVRIYYDYDETVATTVSKDATSGYNVGDRLQFRFHLGRKCQAVKFEISDQSPAGNKDSFRLFGLELEIGVKGGHFRQGSSNTIQGS